MDLKESACALLSTTTVSFAADAHTTLYTVPVGKRCILSHAVVVVNADASTTDVSIGANGTETDFCGPFTLELINAQYDAFIMKPIGVIATTGQPLLCKSYAAATVIEMAVTNQAGAAGSVVYLYGTLY